MRRVAALVLGILAAVPEANASPRTIPIFDGGERVGEVDPGRAQEMRLTVIDLSDDWTVPLYTAAVPYRTTMLTLANEQLPDGEPWRHAREDRYFELYGIAPSLGVIRARLADTARHACHASASPDTTSVAALQEHLSCEGLLAGAAVDGRFGPRTADALAAYRRRHMLFASGAIDDESRATLFTDSRELDFRAALRVLRERVADAGGLIEDGSALNEPGTVVGRTLDDIAVRDPDGWAPLPGGAPDHISAATDAAARALGWTGPEGVVGFFATLSEDDERDLMVAVRLPPPPPYHGVDMPLRAEIDRGDVWRSWSRRGERPARHPALIVVAETPDGDVPLVRWPTTIGGWQREKLPGGAVVRRYKESHPGEFVWRDVVSAPVWFPPPTTPDPEISEESLGPGYRSAYGLVAILHHRREERRGVVRYEDTGVRTHGSFNYRSVRVGAGGHSHGCHRVFNHLALRLGTFLVRHRAHEVVGIVTEHFERRVLRGDRGVRLERDARGYLFRLGEPVPVVVLRGRVH